MFLGSGNEKFYIREDKINQHGVISGATGSGKTVTLKILCEELSEIGVPSFVADVKGDLSNLAKIGSSNEKIEKRLSAIGVDDFEFRNYPINIWDIYEQKGIPLRISISELGPLLLSQVLELNETQEGIINILFRVCDDEGMLLLDLKDLNSMLSYLQENSQELSKKYGNITASSISAIRRRLLVLEEEGADVFFGEPSIEVRDLILKDEDGNGYINILNSSRLINKPRLYSIFLIYLFSELFENLPEVGNPKIPTMVFFFDEAHLLFNNISKTLMEKITTVVRLIRSKGVGIFFITQNPLDIPDTISSQLGTKIIHQLRAFSPKEAKAVKEISETLRENPEFDTKEEILNLSTGVAIISTLDEDGIPTMVDKVTIRPPKSSFDVLSGADIDYIVKNSPLYLKYKDSVDRESAYEILEAKIAIREEEEKRLEEEKRFEEERKVREKEEEKLRKEEEKLRKELEREKKEKMKYVNKGIDSMLGTITRTIGREIGRGILGSLKRK